MRKCRSILFFMVIPFFLIDTPISSRISQLTWNGCDVPRVVRAIDSVSILMFMIHHRFRGGSNDDDRAASTYIDGQRKSSEFNDGQITGRMGPFELAFDKLSEDELCRLNGNITEDGGIHVIMSHKGEGWRKPSSGDEVLISYTGARQGSTFDSSEGPKLVQLGQNLLPRGLETALTTSFTRFSRGRVLLSPQYAAPAALAIAATADDAAHGGGDAGRAVYDVELHDWNDVWRSACGGVALRGLGQPAAYSPPAGDGDRLLLRVSAHLVRATRL